MEDSKPGPQPSPTPSTGLRTARRRIGTEARGAGGAVGLAPPCLLPALPLVICEVSPHLWSHSVQALAGDQG